MEKIEFAQGEVILDRFRIEKRLGEGYSATVYQATDLAMNREVALKVIPSGLIAAERVRREIQTAASLNHPNIVTVHDFIETPDYYVVVMELVKGATLRHALRRKGRIPWQKAVYVASQVAEALKEAHAHEIIHRDIKPENIMITRDGRIKLADFGISVLIQRGNHERRASGTPGYMSPEQLTGRYVDETTDLFALGVVLYEMLTGKNPFYADSLKETALRVMSFTPPPPSAVFPALPAALDAVVMQAIGKDPEFRFQSAAQFIKALREVQESELKVSDEAAAPRVEDLAATAAPAPVERLGAELARLNRHLRTAFFVVSLLLVLYGSISLGSMYTGLAATLIPLGIVLVGLMYPSAALWLSAAVVTVPVFATHQLLGALLGIALATYALVFGYGRNAYFAPLPFLTLYLFRIGLWPATFLLAGLVLEPAAAMLAGLASGVVAVYATAVAPREFAPVFFAAARTPGTLDLATLDGILRPVIANPVTLYEIALFGVVSYVISLTRRGLSPRPLAGPVALLVGVISLFLGYVLVPSLFQGAPPRADAALAAMVPSAILAGIVSLFLAASELGARFIATTQRTASATSASVPTSQRPGANQMSAQRPQ